MPNRDEHQIHADHAARSDPMTIPESDLERWRKLAEATTPGEWTSIYSYDVGDNQGGKRPMGHYVKTVDPMEPYPGLIDKVKDRMRRMGHRRLIATIETFDHPEDD